jgi:hypothetical protein
MGELDRIIDNALSSYSEVTPRPGLEQRVRNRIRIGEADRRRAIFLRFALPFAAALLLLAIALSPPHSSGPKIPDVAVAVQQAKKSRSDYTIQPRASENGRIRTARAKSLPKEQQFPIVTPFTGAERALLALVAQYPAEAQQVVTDMQERSSDPIEIRAIEIQPLRSDGER